jgi:hypothetical protein
MAQACHSLLPTRPESSIWAALVAALTHCCEIAAAELVRQSRTTGDGGGRAGSASVDWRPSLSSQLPL